ncbi:sensor histidine kinase [Duganella sp. FT92W]|uniref:C4-dicarboxylate transport sensor protein DctB n=1 Tax=Pseudoduganella rivuli TaxID=2666085 RepID=A0A7X2ITA4_9BURK|nr:ATP-binding protein [Pseudoduganella rivuli]MRV75672.1 sensor histidine kinase [Pseudoduganella rivuli]
MPPLHDTTTLPSALAPGVSAARTPRRRWRGALAWCVVALVGAALAWLAYWWLEELNTERVRTAGARRLETYAASLENLLDKYEFLPRMLELDKDVVALLQHQDDPALRHTVNDYLERLNRQAGTSTIYIVNLQGRTQAASNWRQKDSFVGDYVAFRPYLQDALRGRSGRFYGVGTTNREAGYFFAQGIYRDGKMLGVATVKVNISELEKSWNTGTLDKVMLADSNGVIFLSSAPAWRYRTLGPLPAAVRAHLEQTRQYHQEALPPLRFDADVPRADGTRVVTIRDPGAPDHMRALPMLAQTRMLAPRQWNFIYLSDLSTVRANSRIGMVFAILAYGFLVLLFLFFRQRRRALRQRMQAREDLLSAYNSLEAMVAERTSRLEKITQSLSEEIEVRRQAEQQLHRTQSELFHAGKMAVLGQMSASITHELNQPLTALRTMSDNAVLLFERGRVDDARNNLKNISQIVARMGTITGKLKTFARKSNDALVAVSIETAISNTLVLIERRLSLEKVTFQLRIAEPELYALCDSNRLEQVLLNLMTNALDSMASCGEKVLSLSAGLSDAAGEWLEIRVADTGPGLSEEARARLFEPFYTTKPQGQGLGLGLAISAQIVQDFGGTLSAEQTGAGACFVIKLKTAPLEI